MSRSSHRDIVLEEFPEPTPEIQEQELDMPDPHLQAREIIEQAGIQARQIIDEARQNALLLQSQAEDSGHAEGLRIGKEEAWSESKELLKVAEAIVEQTQKERQRVLASSEHDVVELALSIAKKIVAAELTLTPELVIDACRDAMEYAFRKGAVQVMTAPSDLALLEGASASLSLIAGVKELSFVAETDLSPGDIIVKTEAGDIDAKIETKTELISDQLLELARQQKNQQLREIEASSQAADAGHSSDALTIE